MCCGRQIDNYCYHSYYVKIDLRFDALIANRFTECMCTTHTQRNLLVDIAPTRNSD